MNVPTIWPGRYYDGQTPTPQLAQIKIVGGTLEVSTINQEHFSWRLQHLTQTQGQYSGEEIRLEYPTPLGGALVVEDPQFLTTLHRLAPQHVQHLHDPRTRRRRQYLAIGAGLFSLPLLWMLYSQGVSMLSVPLTHLIPFSWERELGNTLLSELAPLQTHCSNVRLQEKVDALMKALTEKLSEGPHQFQVTLVDHSDINAMALPGGNIILFRGLLEKTDTPEELAGVLAHEIQHILRRHGLRLLVQNMTMGLIIGALAGDASGILTFVLDGAQMLQSLSYSRSAEEEADQKGLELLVSTGINPEGMFRLLQSMQNQVDHSPNPQGTPFLLTHPLPKDRIGKLAPLVLGSKNTFRPLFPLDDWEELVVQCHEHAAGPRLNEQL